MRHNRLRDLIAKMLKEVCYDVRTEPHLLKVNDGDCVLPHTNKAEQARLDISARGVWTSFDKSFFDVRVTGGGVMSLRVPTSLRLWTICVSRDMTSGTRRDAQGRSSKKGGKMISTTH